MTRLRYYTLPLLICLSACSAPPEERNASDLLSGSAAPANASENTDTTGIGSPSLSTAPVVTGYPVPPAIDLTPFLPENWCPGQFGCLSDTFRPIGWSEEGRYFAFATEAEREAADGYALRVSIQDMASDEVAWEWNYEKEFDPRSEADYFTRVADVWRSPTYDTISEGLREYAIQPYLELPDLGTFPTQRKDRIYRVETSADYYDNPNFGVRQVTKESIKIRANGLGEKTIFATSYKEYDFVLRSRVGGFLISQNGQRMALLHLMERRGWEGPPNVIHFRLIGCAVETGFQ